MFLKQKKRLLKQILDLSKDNNVVSIFEIISNKIRKLERKIEKSKQFKLKNRKGKQKNLARKRQRRNLMTF